MPHERAVNLVGDLIMMQAAVDEAAIRAELIRAFEEDQDARPVVLWKPGERWRNDTGVASFPEQQRIYLEDVP